MRCASCHEEIAIVLRYCPFCGTPIVTLDQAHAEAVRLFCEGSYDSAVAKFEFAHATNPDDPAIARDFGHALLHAGRTDRARQMYAEAIGKARHHADLNFNYALLLISQQELPAAREMLQAVASASRVDFFPGRFYLGLIYPSLNHFLADVFLHLGLVEHELLRISEAAQCLITAIERNPRQAGALIALGDIRMEQRDYEDAIHRYATALEQNPLSDEVPELHMKLGMAFERTGDLADAVKEWRWVLQRDPHNISALENLSRLVGESTTRSAAVAAAVSAAQADGPSTVPGLTTRGGENGEVAQLVGSSPEMRRVVRHARLAAASDSTVLITGEHGTGKELIARVIVANSPRRDRPFVTVNCAAIPETLLESDLFGHEKGSFTGAASLKHGRFEVADTGTIFLDEIAEISPAMQVKLLRVLQEREFNRVGGNEVVRTDVRVIAATNRNLQQMIAAGGFREDLFYRLNVVPIHIPPLRERRQDIPLLVHYFLERLRKRYPKAVADFQPDEIGLFQEYNWPGNVRELENMIERAVVMGTQSNAFLEELEKLRRATAHRDTVAVDNMPELTLDELERIHIMRILLRTSGNQKLASQILGINQSTLYRKMKRYGQIPLDGGDKARM